jgi:hypothetical protein
MRYRLLAAAAVTFLTAGLATAQPAKPAVELRVRSVNDLVDRFEYIAGLLGKEDEGKQVKELLKNLAADGKGIEGIDPKKPIGAYAILAEPVDASPIVVMVPVADEERLLKMLKERFNIEPEKGEDGTLKANVPQLNEIHIRFANGYLYGAKNAKDLAVKGLATPKAFFAVEEKAVAALAFHIDRVPADLRKFALAQVEKGLAEQQKMAADTDTPAEKKGKEIGFDVTMSLAKAILEDGTEVAVRLYAEPKTDDLWAEVSLAGKSGSAMAKNFASLGGRPSHPVAIVGADTVARGNIKFALTDELMKQYKAGIEDALKEAIKDAPAEMKEVAEAGIAAIKPTLAAGELDAAIGLLGPDSKGRYQLVGAVAVKDGKKIEEFVKDTVKKFGGAVENDVEFKFDTDKVGDFTLHKVVIKKDTDEKFQKLFGTKTVWLATGDKCVAFSIEEDGAALKKGLKAKPVPAAMLAGEVSASRILPLADMELKPDEIKALVKDALGNDPKAGEDVIRFAIEGGDKLAMKISLKGKAVRLFAGMQALKGK